MVGSWGAYGFYAPGPWANMSPNGQPADPGVKVDPRTEREDKIRQLVDGLSDIERATLYWYLYASGWTVTRAMNMKNTWKEPS